MGLRLGEGTVGKGTGDKDKLGKDRADKEHKEHKDRADQVVLYTLETFLIQ